jgi:hypothetical protein
MIYQIAGVIPDSHSVSLAATTYYAHNYDSMMPSHLIRGRGPLHTFRVLAHHSLLLANLASRAQGIIYVGPRGFLTYGDDERRFELEFLKKHGVKVALYWCGSDIRSTVLMHELERDMGLPNIFTYIGMVAPDRESTGYERAVRARAKLSDAVADIVFDNPTDHKSYVQRHSEPFFYFMPQERFSETEGKFDDLGRVIVAHAATSPVIKGTPLVRAAVAQLKAEGHVFDYVEMLGVSNDEVLAQLRRTHISLNQFYGFTPAVYGSESLAARCVVLQSADGSIETTLAPGANDAWIVTRHYQVYENLKRLLENPQLLEAQANRGQEWARRYGSAAVTGRILNDLLASVLDGTYDRNARASLPNAALWDSARTSDDAAAS